MTDRVETWRVFAATAEMGSFAEASRRLGRSPQAVTRAVAALEERLGARLLNRTTRSVSLTEIGARQLELCRRLLLEFDELESTGEGGEVRGVLSLTAPIVFGRLHVLPVVDAFLREHPAADVRLLLLDRVVSLVDEGVDLGVRIGRLPDSSLRATLVGQVRRTIYASPGYLATAGLPETPADLARHACITFTATTPVLDRWFFAGPDGGSVAVRPRLVVNTAEAASDAAVAGLGVVRLLSYQVDHLVASGKLRPLLKEHEPDPLPIHLVQPAGRHLSPKVRMFAEQAARTLRAKFRT